MATWHRDTVVLPASADNVPVAPIVCAPEESRMAENVPDPAVSVASPDTEPSGSDEVRCTTPSNEVSTVPSGLRAVTRTVNTEPGVTHAGATTRR